MKKYRLYLEKVKAVYEDFLTADEIYNKITGKQEYVEIFKNPSPSELRSIAKESKYIRLGLTDDGDLLAWKGNIFHAVMEKYLQSNNLLSGKGFLLRFVYEHPLNIINLYTNEERDSIMWDKPEVKNLALKKISQMNPNISKIIDTLDNTVLWKKEEETSDDLRDRSLELLNNNDFVDWMKKDNDGERWQDIDRLHSLPDSIKWALLFKRLNSYLDEFNK